MASAIGWYGPLIDLCNASSHVAEFVQFLVFVHKSTPVQYKLLQGGEVVRTDIQVGDDTRRFFSISVWQKKMGSEIVAGSVGLLQNVKVTRFGDFVEARTVQCSSFRCLVDSNKFLFSGGADSLIEEIRVSIATKEKLRKVVQWVRRSEPTISNTGSQSYKKKNLTSINWAVNEDTQSQHCFSLSDVLYMTSSCKAKFSASVGEIFLPVTWKSLNEIEVERRFIKQRLCTMGDNYLADDLICSGCQHCGAPLSSELGFNIAQGTNPLYCPKSSNHIHTISLIYRPFMLYVWDDSEYIPLLVTNKQAEVLFGNISAENVYSSFRRVKDVQTLEYNKVQEQKLCAAEAISQNDARAHQQRKQTRNTYLIWLILLKSILQQRKNSPLRFQVRVDPSKDSENGRFELLSMSIPCPVAT
ncbi:Nucleic acid-binding [Heracleum sosnowskyi]|uniref:Nucleic acid-binding n=1 Tax=Heracleum sosnowskyi TaxID=360622 RepID=A0AAD8MFL1_9APIA|nr:Nucleic acid-binding [Heracleum sosnowskyi]